MEKRINTKVEDYVHDLKEAIKNKILEMQFQETAKAGELAAFVFDLEPLVITKEDWAKQAIISKLPEQHRCVAKRASGEQCTRRKKDDTEFCGTHGKGAPYGKVPPPTADTVQQIVLFTEKICGIVYFLDHAGHVYKTEDVLENKQNPAVIATWIRDAATGRYMIPEFGLVT